MLVAALTPVARRFFRGQQALAATPRTNVPQYGAPPQYHPPPTPPYPDYTAAAPTPIHALPATRAKLGSVMNWAVTSIQLLGETGWGMGAFSAPAWSILYAVSGSKPSPINAVADHNNKTIYFVRGNHDFYISDKSSMYGVSVGKGILNVRRSLFRWPGDDSTIADAVAAFAANVDDRKIKAEESAVDNIDITPGLPFDFWVGTERTQLPTINMAYGSVSSVLVSLLSPNGKYLAYITVDLKNKKVTQAQVNDKIVYNSNIK